MAPGALPDSVFLQRHWPGSSVEPQGPECSPCLCAPSPRLADRPVAGPTAPAALGYEQSGAGGGEGCLLRRQGSWGQRLGSATSLSAPSSTCSGCSPSQCSELRGGCSFQQPLGPQLGMASRSGGCLGQHSSPRTPEHPLRAPPGHPENVTGSLSLAPRQRDAAAFSQGPNASELPARLPKRGPRPKEVRSPTVAPLLKAFWPLAGVAPVSYTHLTLPTRYVECRSRWSPYH